MRTRLPMMLISVLLAVATLLAAGMLLAEEGPLAPANGGLWITRVEPTGGAGHPFDSLQIYFSTPVLTDTFTLADFLFEGPTGPITPVALTQVTADEYQLSLAGLTGLNSYSLVISSTISDTLGSPLDQNHNGTGGELDDHYRAALFSAGVTIAQVDTTYDGKNLIIFGNTATIDGPHVFGSVVVSGNATLAHTAATADHVFRLDLTITDTLWIASGSKIDVSGKGYLAGRTTGNTAWTVDDWSGASYGGLGYTLNSIVVNPTYGDYRYPDEPGSGGSCSGGGLVQITAGQVIIDGSLLANGCGASPYGSGSGGGILLDAGTLSGAGAISANGGRGDYGGGSGGGRVALYYDTLDGFDPAIRATAHGGDGSGASDGAVGTVYYHSRTAGEGVLRLDSHGVATALWTPLGQDGDSAIAVDRLIIAGAGVVAAPQHQMPIRANNLSLLNGSTLTHQPATTDQVYSLQLTVIGTLQVEGGAKIDVTGRGYAAGRTTGNTAWTVDDFSGASYGGLGHTLNSIVVNPTYGDYRNPDEPGSGGSCAGGGLVQITAGQVIIDGSLLANGCGPFKYGSGSGGGILLDAGTLSGAGAISANGGRGDYGGGSGGGRVALYYDTLDGFDPAIRATAHGGDGSGASDGALGTVYYHSRTAGEGVLRLDSHGVATALWTPLGQDSDPVFVVDRLVISGAGVVAAPQHEMPIRANNLSLLNGSTLTHQPATTERVYSLQLTVTNTLQIGAGSRIDVTARGYPAGRTTGNTAWTVDDWSGASYGGLGHTLNLIVVNPTYGDYRYPIEPGSGGSCAGGGLVQITAGQVIIDGSLLANGCGPFKYGSGSGGGILLDAGTLSGAGAISANGGRGDYGGGSGGGRVALYYDALDGFDPAIRATAHGGDGSGASDGAVGTVYYHSRTAGEGVLRLDSHGVVTALWTPLGQDSDPVFVVDRLVISGAGVVAAPQHEMPIRANNLSLLNGSTLTHQPATTERVYSLQLTVTNTLQIGAGSRIDVTARGYPAGRTTGNTAWAVDDWSGASYGGLGYTLNSIVVNPTYGDYRNPDEPGSGGSCSGGGLVQITAGQVIIDGSLLANGCGPFKYGSGSGGGILLDAGTLSGAGAISANGGRGDYGGGSGGGRVALYYDTLDGFDPAIRATAHGGDGSGASDGAVGTVYYHSRTAGEGVLRLDSHGVATALWTPLGQDSDAVFVVDHLVISGTNVIAAPQHEMPIRANNLSLLNGSTLTHQASTTSREYSLRLFVDDTVRISTTARIDVTARGYPPGRTLGNATWAADNFSGASYGGLGAGAVNPTYGDYRNPNELGSGGDGSGGGLVQITAGRLDLDGAIRANGGTPVHYGSGSGGAIRLTVGTLAGSGTISANGGVASGYGRGSGGGRVAITYDSVAGLDLARQVTAHGSSGASASTGAVGTVYVKPGDGVGTLRLDSHGAATGAWTPLGQSGDTLFVVDHLVISGTNVVAAPRHEMPIQGNSVSLYNNAMLTHQTTTASQSYSLRMALEGELIIGPTAKIDVNSRGYPAGRTQGNVAWGALPGWGGSYGGLAGSTTNPIYGDARLPNEWGSGGGHPGGGLVQITAAGAVIDGSILAKGANGGSQTSNQGTGSGGGILLNVGTLTGGGTIAADGGVYSGLGAGGGGGRVAVYTWDSMTMPLANLTSRGGDGYQTLDGHDGTVHISQAPYMAWASPGGAWWHDTVILGWYGLGLHPAGPTVELRVASEGQPGGTTIAAGLPVNGSRHWDTRAVPDGWYDIRATLYDPAAQPIGESVRQVLINNTVAWHRGRLSVGETWAAGTVHVLDGDILISAGVTLTLEPGALIKALPRVGIVVEDGGVLSAPGTSAGPIVLTSLADDTARGDTNLDGSRSSPQPGEWTGVTVQGGGSFQKTAYVSVRYVGSTHTGTLSQSETWDGTYVHRIIGELTVPDGVLLTIEPGAVIKLDSGRSIIVNAGGTLLAHGELARPIVFTSVRDDSVGGDTNQDGDLTAPAPGDWYRVRINGGRASFRHVEMRYGAGTSSVEGALLSTSGAATLAVADSTLHAGLYTGILSWGGTVTVSNTVLHDLDRGASAHPGGTLRLTNCTVEGNRIGVLIHGGTLIMANTISSHNTRSGIELDLGSPAHSVRYCDVWNPGATGGDYVGIPSLTGVDGNISADPAYKNRRQANYRLGYLSPAVDAADGTAAPAADRMGAPRYDDPRTPNTGIPTGTGVYADMGAYEFVETASSELDLAVTSVSGPAHATAGETVTLTWTVVNRGAGLIAGPWHDTISLLYGSPIYAGEVLVGTGVTLGPGQSHQAVAAVRVPGSVVGDHRWQVETNSRGQVFEGQNRGNNIAYSSSSVWLDLPELVIGGRPLTRLFSAAGQEHWFKLVVPAGQQALVSLDLGSATGASELYMGRGALPSLAHYDYRSTGWNTPDVEAAVVGSSGETLYVLAYARSLPFTPVGLTIQASALSWTLGTVDPTRVGNSGAATLRLTGGLLAQEMDYALVSAVGTVYPASQVRVESSALVYATFDLTGAAVGLYDVRVTHGAQVLELADAVEVYAGAGPQLAAQVWIPARMRVGRPYEGYVRYQNVGDSDLVAPILEINSSLGAATRLDPAGAFNNLDLQLIAAAMEGPAGVLRPGQEGLIHFQGVVTQRGPVHHGCCSTMPDSDGPEETMNWPLIEEQVRPQNYNPERWPEVWSAFVDQAGPGSGGYVESMAGYATMVGQRGGQAYSVQQVFQTALLEIYYQLYGDVAGHIYLDQSESPLGDALIVLTAPGGERAGIDLSKRDGSFALEAPDGTYTVTVAGYLVQSPRQIEVPSAGARDVELIVSRGGAIAGQLTGADYAPIGGALVSLVDGQGAVHAAQSDATGRYRLSGLEGGVYTGTVGGDAWGRLFIGPVTVQPEGVVEGLNYILDVAASVRGQVTDSASGQPISDTLVLLTDAAGHSFATASNADGDYLLGGLTSGVYTGRYQAAGHAPFEMAVVPLAAGVELTQDVALGVGASLLVTVRDELTATPIPSATVSLEQTMGGQLTAGAWTDTAGQASLVHLAEGAYVVAVSAEGKWAITDTLTLTPTASVTRDVALHPAGTLSGAVTNGAGQPIPDLPVRLLGREGFYDVAFTQAGGQYAFGNVPAGEYAVSLLNGQLRQPIVISPTALTQSANLTVEGAALEGRVRAAGGSPLWEPAQVLLLKDGQVVLHTTTDADDGYRLVGVPAGSYAVVAANVAGITPQQAVVVAGEEVQAPEIRLGSLAYAGTVRDGGGAPLAGALVWLSPDGPVGASLPQFYYATTETDGAFQFGGLAAGAYQLRVYRPGCAGYRQAVTVTAPGANLGDVTLAPGNTLFGIVSSIATGQPLEDAVVMVFDAGDQAPVGLALTGADGAYRVEGLAAGVYNLVVSAAGHRQEVMVGQSVQGPLARSDFCLVPPSTALEGLVLDPGFRPVPGVSVSAYNNRGERVAIQVSGYDGAYRFDELPAGSYTVRAQANGFAPAAQAGNYLTDGYTTGGVDLRLESAGAAVMPSLAAALRGPSDSRAIDGRPNVWQAARAMADFVLRNLELPTRAPGDYAGGPGIPQPEDCTKAVVAWAEAKKLLMPKDSAFSNWWQNYWSFASGAAYSYASVALLYLDMAGTMTATALMIWATPLWTAAEADFIASSPNLYVLLQIGQVFGDFYSLIMGAMDGVDWANGADVLAGITGGLDDLIGVAGSLDWIKAAQKALGEVSKIPELGLPFGVVSSIMKALNLLGETYKAVEAANNNLKAVEAARINYLDAWDKLDRAITAVHRANLQCQNHEENAPQDEPEPGGGGDCDGGGAGEGEETKDPNDKLTVGFSSQGFVGPGSTLMYTVHFENVPTATLAVQQAVITDLLDPNLDWSTLELVGVGFNQVSLQLPAGLQEYEATAAVATDPYPVVVTAGLDPATGVLSWVFESVDPVTKGMPEDPLAGFLPPNDDQQRGEGYVLFTIRPKEGLPDGQVFYNRARIVFDVNPPLDTPVVTNTIDGEPPTSTVLPLPAESEPSFVVSWAGSDGEGSGVGSYAVWVSENSGPFRLWLARTPETQATFAGTPGYSYNFYSVATDRVGNRQGTPAEGQAATTVRVSYPVYLPVIMRR